jgi:Fic family protein
MKNFTSGFFQQVDKYKAFVPEKINRQWLIEDMELIQLLSEAERALGNFYIAMHVVKEATYSSKIEGTKTNIEDVLSEREDILEERRNDWQEVNNYIQAMNTAISELSKLPLSTRLIKKAHKILITGVRGEQKLPGEYRTSQNWIGGASLRDAVFIPPPHHLVNELMKDLENFLHNDDFYFPYILRIALAHYQFETIHPFLDGNGRVGRMLITLYLVEKKVLKRPVLYLSDFFESNRTHYYNNLMKVRIENDIKHWFKFFLIGLIETAEKGITTFDKILQLQKNIDEKLSVLKNRKNKARQLLNYMFEHPVVNAYKVKRALGFSMPTIYKLLAELEQLDLIREQTGARRNRSFLFKAYTDLFE